MQLRSLIFAVVAEAAILFGVGLGLYETRDATERRVVAVLPPSPAPEIRSDLVDWEVEEPPPWTSDTDVADPAPPAASRLEPDPVPTEQDSPEPEAVLDPLPPAPMPAGDHLLLRMRRPPPPEPPPIAATPAAKSPAEPGQGEAASPRGVRPVVPDVPAAVLDEHNVPPAYPQAAQRRGIAGEVRLLVHVDATGEVERVELRQSAGLTRWHKMLDRAAIAAVCRWRYAPARRNGRAVSVIIEVPIEFQRRPRR